MTAKTIHNSLARGAACAIWIAALFVGFWDFLIMATDDPFSAQATKDGYQCIGCIAVFVIAAITHACLISRAVEGKENG